MSKTCRKIAAFCSQALGTAEVTARYRRGGLWKKQHTARRRQSWDQDQGPWGPGQPSLLPPLSVHQEMP